MAGCCKDESKGPLNKARTDIARSNRLARRASAAAEKKAAVHVKRGTLPKPKKPSPKICCKKATR